MDLKPFIRDIADFPQAGVLFRDITPLLGNPEAFGETLDRFAANYRDGGVEAVVGIESRGFIFGAPLADRLRVPFVPVRKPGKLPAPRMSIEYTLEYGHSQLDIAQDALKPGQRVLIVDDVLATGGTAAAAAKLVELIGGQVHALQFLIELAFLGGRARLENYRIETLLTY
jgi:adenine phosphoribosyltransferase